MEENKEKSNGNSKIKQLVIALAGILVIAALALGMILLYNSRKEDPQEGVKSITLEVISERDNYEFKQDYETDQDYLGDFLEKNDLIGFDTSDYGRFITSVQGYSANNEEQSWWSIAINGESAVTGVDDIVLADGSVYTLELKIGW